MEKQSMIDSFHLMWDSFPDPAIIINREKEIIASNKAAEKAGRTKGMKCSSLMTPAAHKGCRAALAFRNNKTEFLKKQGGTGELILYWMPVEGFPDYLIHVSMGAVTKY